ncbi:MAG: hypothetical protein ACRDLS_00020 [Solirubrobacteraceae bacterium]
MNERRDSTARPAGDWTPEELARERAATQARLERARARGAEVNLKEAAALARFANKVAAAAEDARRDERS